MINIIPYKDLGQADYGWLQARYHFSFGDYHNPARMGFGPLRVINDDIVKAGAGFDPHPHRNMEIITYVRSGAITHLDSLGNEGRTEAGDVQVMSAGSGITHAEYNREPIDTTLYQIWIHTREKNISPRWDSLKFPKVPVNDSLSLLVSGRADDKDRGALYINADAEIYGGRLEAGKKIEQHLSGPAYLLASDGAFSVNGLALSKGDGAEISGEIVLTITAGTASELLLISLPTAA